MDRKTAGQSHRRKKRGRKKNAHARVREGRIRGKGRSVARRRGGREKERGDASKIGQELDRWESIKGEAKDIRPGPGNKAQGPEKGV